MTLPTAADPWAWFDEARFGLFIHWGIYSVLGRGEQVLFRERLDAREYARLAQRFKPQHFDAEDWARQARDAGMRYAVLTTKHHDGFCLFDSRVSRHTAPRTAAGRDLVAEYVSAMRSAGLRVGLYYSLADWTQPAYFLGPQRDPEGFAQFVEYTHTQVRELCSNYGQVDVLWFDGGWPWSATDWQSERLDATIRGLQPYVWMNDRLHGGGVGNVAPVGDFSERTQGYYDTAEQRAPGSPAGRPIESCRTSQHKWWGYHAGNRLWKDSKELVATLAQTASAGANLLYNVGPKPDGTIPAPFSRSLKEVGEWLAVNGEAVYGTGAGVGDTGTLGPTTTRGNHLYLHVLYWPGRESNLYGFAGRVLSAELLATGQPAHVSQDGLHIRLSGLPARPPDRFCSVIRIEFDAEPRTDPSFISLWQRGADTQPLAQWARRGCTEEEA